MVAASWSGKAKTVMQMVTLPFAYFYLMLSLYPESDPVGTSMVLLIMWWLMHLMILASLALTVGSGLRFFIKNWKAVKEVTTYE